MRRLWFLSLALVATLAISGAVNAQGLGQLLNQGVCRSTERSVVLFESDDALTQQVLEQQARFDQRQSLVQRLPVPLGEGVRPLCLDGQFDLRGAEESGSSEALASWPVVVVIARDQDRPIRVFAHVPELSAWAGDIFLEVGGLDWVDSSSVEDAADISVALLPLMTVAEQVSATLRAFSAGDLEGAISVRPESALLDPLPRAWLSGIPETLPAEVALLGSRDPTYDEPPSIAGRNPLDLFLAVANGEISAEESLRLSVPANDVRCDWGASTKRAEVQWAGFVSGFWYAIQDVGHGFEPDDALGALNHVLADHRTCFASPIVKLIERLGSPTKFDRFIDGLDLLVEANMAATFASAEVRRKLAAEMVAGFAAIESLPEFSFEFVIEDDQPLTIGLNSKNWIGSCTGPDLAQSDRIAALTGGIAADQKSPMALMLAVSEAARRQSTAGVDFDVLLDQGTVDWLGIEAGVGNTLINAVLPIDPVLARKVSERLRSSERSSVNETMAFMANATDAEFAEALERLKTENFGFERQSDLARALLFENIEKDTLKAISGSPIFGFLDPRSRRTYDRLRQVVPRLDDELWLDSLFEVSNQNAIRIAEIDLLNFYFSLSVRELLAVFNTATEGSSAPWADLKFAPERRNPWRLFATNPTGLPDIPIPALDKTPFSGAVSVQGNRPLPGSPRRVRAFCSAPYTP